MRQKIDLNKTKEKTFDRGYDEFIIYCKARNLRPATIKHYDDSMRIIYQFIQPKTLIKDITETTVEEFKIFLREKTTENDVTQNTNIRVLRTVLYYFMKLGYMKEFKISEIKVDKSVIETYTDEELRILLQKPDIKKCSFVEYRNWAIINFLMGTGCRMSTLINIKIKDIDLENDLVTYRHTKNRKQAIIPISNNLKVVLVEYLQLRNGKDDDYLFCTAYGEKINPNTLNKAIEDYNKRKGVVKTGIHRFRHTFAKKWIMAGGDVFRLQKILCHSDMEVVKNYVNMFTNDLQQDFNTFNPLEQIKVGRKHIDNNFKGGRR